MKLFVAGLPNDMDDAELEEFFEKFGTVTSVKVAMDRETGKSRGFAFVEMPLETEAREAIEGLNNLAIGRKLLVVKQAEEKPGGGGGYNKGSGSGGYDRDRRGGGGGFNKGGGGGGYNKGGSSGGYDRDRRNRY